MIFTNTPDNETKQQLQAVQSWIFDLDNTLYEAQHNFFEFVSKRMTIYLCHYFGLDAIGAREIQRHYYHHYGTTLRGLMINDGVDPSDFLSFTHDIDYTHIKPRPDLVEAMNNLIGTKLIITNGPKDHANHTLKALGFNDEFDGIQDIVGAHYIPKPAREPYEQIIKQFNLTPSSSIIFEDLPENLIIPKAMGMKTVLIVDSNNLTSFQKPLSELPQSLTQNIDWVTSDLVAFLTPNGEKAP